MVPKTLKVDLSQHTNCFASSRLEFSIAKKVNFIFGKNGTGKTTIANEVASQLSDGYDVHVFKDFDGVAENDRLNAVALGTENAEIQKKIDIIDSEIAEISRQVDEPENKGLENLFTKAKKAKKDFDDQDKKISDFHTLSAQQIKNINNPTIAKTSYDKNDFRDEILKANSLPDSQVTANKNTIRSDKKVNVSLVSFPVIDLQNYLDSTNEVLQLSVSQPQSIPELKDNPAKQTFAKQGMTIHEHMTGEICAFCGSEISEKRWVALGNYFNDEVKKLENSIQNGVQKLRSELMTIASIEELDKSAFYEKYGEQVKMLNAQIMAKKSEYKEFLQKLETVMDGKNNALFVKIDVLKIAVPKDFSEIQKHCAILINDNNELSKNLANEQDKAKGELRYHEIKNRLDTFKYTDKHTELETLRKLSDDAKEALDGKKSELQLKQTNRADLILETKDENKIAEKINRLLRGMGVASFSLELVNDDENQKGQYQIKSHDGNTRPVTQLSKGEKNIIAFLYFIFDVERADGNNNPKIIVLDDPMTSNDDTMQYLMIGEIQKFYRSLKDGSYFLLFTHNIHFYLNVRPDTAKRYKVGGQEASFYEKYGAHHLLSDGKHTMIKIIDNGKQDFKTNYEALWKELVFLYETVDATSDLMLSPSRKICETYMNFTKKGIASFYVENINAKKLFDVNQHSIDDLEAEQNGKTKDEIKNILSELFKQNGAEDHFNNYWKESQYE